VKFTQFAQTVQNVNSAFNGKPFLCLLRLDSNRKRQQQSATRRHRQGHFLHALASQHRLAVPCNNVALRCGAGSDVRAALRAVHITRVSVIIMTTFSQTRSSARSMNIDIALCVSVCLSVCLSICGRMPTLLHGPGWRSGRECPLAVHCWADLQSVHGLRYMAT